MSFSELSCIISESHSEIAVCVFYSPETVLLVPCSQYIWTTRQTYQWVLPQSEVKWCDKEGPMCWWLLLCLQKDHKEISDRQKHGKHSSEARVRKSQRVTWGLTTKLRSYMLLSVSVRKGLLFYPQNSEEAFFHSVTIFVCFLMLCLITH